ncbi:MAG: helix-turn-helix transcriptional regulator [Rhodospirillaceae bacterium]
MSRRSDRKRECGRFRRLPPCSRRSPIIARSARRLDLESIRCYRVISAGTVRQPTATIFTPTRRVFLGRATPSPILSTRNTMKRKEDAPSGSSAELTSSDVLQNPGAVKLLRCEAVQERTGLSRTTLWRMERRGEFPKRVHLTSSLVAWLEEEVVAWIRSRRNGAAA